MTGTFVIQFVLTLGFGVGVLLWAWSGFSSMQFGLRTVLSWSAIALSFPAAAIANRAFEADLKQAGISATGLLLATFALCTLVALSATTEQASRALRVGEAALLEGVFARELERVREFLNATSQETLVGVVVIPAFNEAESILDVVNEVTKSVGWPILVIDDGSRDSTSSRAKEGGAFVVRLPENLGVGAAVRLGIRLADGAGAERILQFDADGQHPGEQAKVLLAAADDLVQDSDSCLVIGSRFLSPGYKIGRVRRMAIGHLSKTIESRNAVRVTDPSSGFRLFAGRPLIGFAAQKLPTEYLGDTFGFLQLALDGNFDVREVGVQMRSRQGGEASVRGLGNLKFLLRVLINSAKRST
jgi:hypothetical protein